MTGFNVLIVVACVALGGQAAALVVGSALGAYMVALLVLGIS